MAKTPITREELTLKALAAIRGEPGCGGIREVNVSGVDIVGGERCWHVTVIDEGGTKLENALHAAQRVEDRLNPQYELIYSSERKCSPNDNR
jgi:hypothetical protein